MHYQTLLLSVVIEILQLTKYIFMSINNNDYNFRNPNGLRVLWRKILVYVNLLIYVFNVLGR